MSTSNGINSDSFSRSDVIKTYQVVQYFGGILTQYPIVTNIQYDDITGIITANGITSAQATSGTTQTPLTLRGANSNSATRPGATVQIAGGNGSGGSGAGGVSITSGGGGGELGSSSLVLTNLSATITDRNQGTLTIADGGCSFSGGYNPVGEIKFSAGYGDTITFAGRPIIFATDTGNILEMQEETSGTPKIGFFGQTPLSAKPSISGSRGGNAALADLLTKLAALGLITDGTSA